MSVSVAGDYAAMDVGEFQFYYGYEVTTENGTWCFQMKYKGREVYKVPAGRLPGLHGDMKWEPHLGLLAGIEWVMEQHPPKFWQTGDE